MVDDEEVVLSFIIVHNFRIEFADLKKTTREKNNNSTERPRLLDFFFFHVVKYSTKLVVRTGVTTVQITYTTSYITQTNENVLLGRKNSRQKIHYYKYNYNYYYVSSLY